MKKRVLLILVSTVALMVSSCTDNNSPGDLTVSLDLNSTSNWDVTNFQSEDGIQLDIPEAAIWSMTLSPRDEDFSGSMRFRVYCDLIDVEFILVDQVMRRTSAVGGTGGILCMPWEIEDTTTSIAVQRAETTILNAINRGEGVYGVTQENADLFMLSIPEAGVITFERNSTTEK